MDAVTTRIAEFAAGLDFGQVPGAIVARAKQSLVDSIGCGLGGRDCEPAAIGRRLAHGTVPAIYPGRILFCDERSSAEGATFVNSAMIRYLDFNDQRYGGHPSDMLGGLLAVAETLGVSGRKLLSGMLVGYETALRMTESTQFRKRGYDQGFSIAIGTAAGVGHMMGLPAARIRDAIAIAVVGSVPLRATRAGHLSLWKGAATAFACRNGVFAALLAAEGMTGPEKPIEGRHGLWEQITGPFDYETLPTEGGVWKMSSVRMKFWPVEYNAQIAVWAALELRKMMPVEEITEIDIATYWSAWHEIGSEPAKWDPTNRETADHSMPYCFARGLVDGRVDLATFDQAAYLEPSLRPLMAKIKVHEDEAINAAFPATVGIRVDVVDRGGRKHVIDMKNPRGHEDNPLTDAEIDSKFLGLTEPALGKDAAASALRVWRAIDEAPGLADALEAVVPRKGLNASRRPAL